MVALQIRDVPESVRDSLAAAAREKGQSLQAYLREIVTREAGFANNALALDEVSAWNRGSGATGDDVLAALDAARQGAPA